MSGRTPSKRGEPSELELLGRMPPEMLDWLALGGRPDGRGMVGRNRKGWIAVSFQREAMPLLCVGVQQGDRRYATEAWRAIDAAFGRQAPEGNKVRLANAHHSP